MAPNVTSSLPECYWGLTESYTKFHIPHPKEPMQLYPPIRTVPPIQPITEPEIRETVVRYAENKILSRIKPAQLMTITDLNTVLTCFYKLENLVEYRFAKWVYHSHYGGSVDSPVPFNPTPGPWDISVDLSSDYVDCKGTYKVPRTSFVLTCHTCYGTGRVTCMGCGGTGRVSRSRTTTDSNGNSRTEYYYETCISCGGTGRQICYTCSGTGELEWYIRLKVKHCVHEEEYHGYENIRIPKRKISIATTVPIFLEDGQQVCPIQQLFDQEAVQFSIVKIDSWIRVTAGDLLKQRHQLHFLPICEANLHWKRRNEPFLIIGTNGVPYFPNNYPGDLINLHCC